jgi:DNA-binding response OmpR family regulator
MTLSQTTTDPVVLVVDDELELRTLLEEYLSHHGLTVRSAPDASSARAMIAESVPTLVLLDLNRPGESGLDLARWLRGTYPAMGLVMLTTSGTFVDRIVGLELGADDYVPKPFELRELLARVRAVLRRVLARGAGPDARNECIDGAASPGRAQQLDSGAEQRVQFGACVLDLVSRRLLAADGSDVEISAAEFDLLALFARHPNRPLNRDQIMEQAHNRSWDVYDRSVDLRVMRLRRKVERNPDRPEVIKTVRSVGYMFVSKASGTAPGRNRP